MENRGRVDKTSELKPYERRMDSLAKLLARKSECVAILVMNDTFYIAANEFFSGTTQKNENRIFIKNLLHDFEVFKDKNLQSNLKKEKEIFEKICLATKKDKNSVINLSDEIVNNCIDNAFEYKPLTLPELFDKYGKETKEVMLLLAKFYSLYKPYFKIKNGLSNENKKGKLTEEQFKAFSNKCEILLNESTQGIHAEVQLLSHIVNLIINNKIDKKDKKEIYIGISKLCCLNCRVMLEAANKIFFEKNISISFNFRGHHDISFDKDQSKSKKRKKDWIPPKLFEEGYVDSRTSVKTSDSIEYLIGYHSGKTIEDLKKTSQAPVSMNASESSSKDEDLFLDEEIHEVENFLKIQTKFLNTLENHQHTKLREMLAVVNKLHANADILDAVKIISNDKSDQTRENLFNKWLVKTKDMNIAEEDLLWIIQNPYFMGETIAEFFKAYTLDSVNTQENSEKGTQQTNSLVNNTNVNQNSIQLVSSNVHFMPLPDSEKPQIEKPLQQSGKFSRKRERSLSSELLVSAVEPQLKKSKTNNEVAVASVESTTENQLLAQTSQQFINTQSFFANTSLHANVKITLDKKILGKLESYLEEQIKTIQSYISDVNLLIDLLNFAIKGKCIDSKNECLRNISLVTSENPLNKKKLIEVLEISSQQAEAYQLHANKYIENLIKQIEFADKNLASLKK